MAIKIERSTTTPHQCVCVSCHAVGAADSVACRALQTCLEVMCMVASAKRATVAAHWANGAFAAVADVVRKFGMHVCSHPHHMGRTCSCCWSSSQPWLCLPRGQSAVSSHAHASACAYACHQHTALVHEKDLPFGCLLSCTWHGEGAGCCSGAFLARGEGLPLGIRMECALRGACWSG